MTDPGLSTLSQAYLVFMFRFKIVDGDGPSIDYIRGVLRHRLCKVILLLVRRLRLLWGGRGGGEVEDEGRREERMGGRICIISCTCRNLHVGSRHPMPIGVVMSA